MHTHRVAEEQIARTGGQDSRRKALKITIDRRKHRVLQIMAIGIKLGGVAEPAVIANQDVVDHFVGQIGVARLCHVGPRRTGRSCGWQW